MTTDMINILNVSKNFGDFSALKDVNIDVGVGTSLGIVGPSGAGKSTLLRCINRLERQDEGIILVDNEPMGYQWKQGAFHALSESMVSKQRLKAGMVFQHFNLFPHKTCLENVSEGLTLVKKIDAAAARDRALAELDRVGLRSKADAYPGTLSGGQMQRVGIARALAMSPKVMLFDEVTSALDPELVDEVVRVVREVRDSGMTMVTVTHQMSFAKQVSDEVVFMDQGRVVEKAEVDEFFESPQEERTRTFLKATLAW